MALIRINPTKMLVGGNKKAAKNFLGPARSQLEILKQSMTFQNLSQGIRKIWLNEDVYVECRKIFNYQECKVWVRPEVWVRPTEESWQAILIISSQDESEAIAWDLFTNTMIGEKSSLADLYTFLNKSSALPGTPVQVLTTGSGTDILPVEYDSRNPSQINGTCPYTITGPVNPEKRRPYFIIDERFIGTVAGFSGGGIFVGDTVVFQTEEESEAVSILSADWVGVDSTYITGHLVGSINATWTITIFEWGIDPQFSVKNNITGEVVVGEIHIGATFYDPDSVGAEYFELEGEEGKRGAYMWYLYSEQMGAQNDSDIFQNYFEALSGTSWPNVPSGLVGREYAFFNPVFGADLHDIGAGLPQSYLAVAMERHWDSWEATDDYSIGDSIIDRMMQGCASAEIIKTTGEVIKGDVVMDWYTFCYDYEGSVAEGSCVDYDKFFHHPHIYFRVSDDPDTLFGLLAQVNNERILRDLEPLKVNRNLQVAANKHAQWMADNLTFSHTGLDGSNPSERIRAENYLLYNFAAYQEHTDGENLITSILGNTSSDLVAAWMLSPGHRANILREEFLETGLAGATGSDGRTYICQTFGYRQDVWPGFSPFEPTELKNYVKDNFLFSSDSRRVPKAYFMLRGLA